jgi:hypothetical protein
VIDPKDPAQFFPFFILLWCVASFSLSLLGGWFSLAQHYRATQPFVGERWHMRSASLRFVSYGSCLILGSNTQGLFLSVLFPFRIGHPPLFIPWSEVLSAEHYKIAFLFPMVRFRFKQEPSASFKISRGLALEIAEQAHGRVSIAGG